MAFRLKRSWTLLTAALLVTLPGCSAASSDEVPMAEAIVQGYFAALSEGRFDDAAGLYAGDFEELSAINPDVDPQDHALLFERWCTQNGGVCLPILAIVSRDVLDDGSVRFRVQFSNADGSLFEIGPCCGEVDTGQRTNEFDYVVRRIDGDLRVLQLPPYVP
ncbi:MAG: hypothetical protein A2Y93_00430 [Chloroflexi bacterium RBG_13_68_17]|nr:MAG: hypothetical protein A2Y93_00430 [Chloroflexi bacterium RBG_13_68_17]